MKLFRFFILFLLLSVVTSGALAQNSRYNGRCDNPGLTITVGGTNSIHKVDRVVPSCTVTAYNQGTIVAATIYSDAAGTPLANPFTANSDGTYAFYASPGLRVDLQHTGGTSPNNYSSAFTISDVTVGNSSGTSPPFVDTQTIIKGSTDATKLLRFEVDGFTSGATRTLTPPNASITIVGAEFANAWADGIKQTFNPSNSVAGLNPGSNASDPTIPAAGDMYYNSTSGKFRCYENGAWVNCISGSGGSPGSPSLSLQYNNAGSFAGISTVTTNGTVVTYATGSLATPDITNTGLLTLPTSTDTLTGRATTDTFTNKSLLASSNTLGGVTIQIGSDATGDTYYRASGGTLARRAIGTSNQVLTVSGGLPVWATPSGMTTLTIGTTTITSGTATRLLYETSGNLLGEITGITSNGTTLTVSQAITWSDGVTQTFNPSGTASGLNIGGHTSDPSAPNNGDIFYNSTSNKFRCYENGGWTNCIGASSGTITGPGSSTDNAIARWDGTTGTAIQDSVVTIADSTGAFSGALISTGNTLGNVTVDVTGTDATGDIWYRDSGGIFTRLGIGSNGQVLTVSGGLPSWASSSAGTITVGTTAIASGTATRLVYETSGNVFGEISGATSDGTTVTLTSPVVTTSLTTGSTTFALLNTTATTVNFAGATTTLNIGASAAIVLNFGGSTTAGEFRFLEPSGSGTNYTAFKAVAQSANITYSLPATIASAGQVLTDVAGNGALSWTTVSGGGSIGGSSGTTDNALIRADGTGGSTIQGSGTTATLSDLGALNIVTGNNTTQPLRVNNSDSSLWIALDTEDVAGTGRTRLVFETGSDDDFRITANTTGVNIVRVFSDSPGVTITPAVTTAIALRISSQANSTADLLELNPNFTNTTDTGSEVVARANSNGTPGAGFGQTWTYKLESNTTDDRTAASMDVVWTIATDASRTGVIKFNTVTSAGSLTERLRIGSVITYSSNILMAVGTGATDNLINVGSASSGDVNQSFGFFVAGVGSADANDGPYFLARGNNFSTIANQAGSMLFVAGNPDSPGTNGGVIRFFTGNESERVRIDISGGVKFYTEPTPNTAGAVALGTSSLPWQQLFIDQTITAGGTTGNQTINKAQGTVNIATGNGAVTVTSNKVTTSSIVFAVARTNDATCSVKNVVPGSGSFTINMTATCTGETSVGWTVNNQ